MNGAVRSLAAGACLALLWACHPRGANDFPVSVHPARQPLQVGETPLDLITQGVPAGARVEVEGNMTHAGMRPVEAVATRVDAQHYRVERFAFSMAGDWILTVTATTTDRTLSSDVPLTVEAP